MLYLQGGGSGSPSLIVTKTVKGNTSVVIGSTVTFEINVTNTGSSDANNVTVTDTLGAGLTCDTVSLNPCEIYTD